MLIWKVWLYHTIYWFTCCIYSIYISLSDVFLFVMIWVLVSSKLQYLFIWMTLELSHLSLYTLSTCSCTLSRAFTLVAQSAACALLTLSCWVSLLVYNDVLHDHWTLLQHKDSSCEEWSPAHCEMFRSLWSAFTTRTRTK